MRWSKVLAAIAALLLALPAAATITVTSWYRMGEADPGAVSGGAGTNPTLPTVGAANLTRFGAPTYTAAAAPNSALAMTLNGSTDAYRSAAVVASVTNDFGIEAWVFANTTGGNRAIAYNGNSGSSGWGLYAIGSNFGVLFGGLAIFGSAAITAGQWTHVAAVRSGGTTTLYVNGIARATDGTTPNVPAGVFSIGSAPTGGEFWDGRIDEVRVFTFAPGQFVVTDLLAIPPPPLQPVPALGPAALALLALLLAFSTAVVGGRRANR
jgi:hypothetical protein